MVPEHAGDTSIAQRPIALFAPEATQPLAGRIAAALGQPLASHEQRRFAGGEFKIRPTESVRARHGWIVQSLQGDAAGSACDKLCELLFLAGAIRDAGAERVGALIPYLSFGRKDRRTKARDPVTSRYLAQLIESIGIEHVMAVEVHNPAAFDNAHRIRADHLTTSRLFADFLAQRFSGKPLAIVSPDLGGAKRAQLLREALQRRIGSDVEFACVEKRRSRDVVSGHRVTGEVADREVVLFDDLISTGETLRRAARACRSAGARAVHAAAAHAPLAGNALEALCDPVLDSIVVTDTIELNAEAAGALTGRLTVVSAADLMARALSCTQGRGSLAELLELD